MRKKTFAAMAQASLSATHSLSMAVTPHADEES